MTEPSTITISVIFLGGLSESMKAHTPLDKKTNKLSLTLPAISPASNTPTTLQNLGRHIRDNFLVVPGATAHVSAASSEADKLRDMENSFWWDGTVGSDLLVLINDADWALEGEHEYELQNRDEIVFLKTSHGG